MSQQTARLAISAFKDIYKVKKSDFDIYVYPAQDGTSAKMAISVTVDRAKVPSTASGEPDVEWSEYHGETQVKDFIFNISKMVVKLIDPQTNAAPAEFRIEFDIPGAVIPKKD